MVIDVVHCPVERIKFHNHNGVNIMMHRKPDAMKFMSRLQLVYGIIRSKELKKFSGNSQCEMVHYHITILYHVLLLLSSFTGVLNWFVLNDFESTFFVLL